MTFKYKSTVATNHDNVAYIIQLMLITFGIIRFRYYKFTISLNLELDETLMNSLPNFCFGPVLKTDEKHN